MRHTKYEYINMYRVKDVEKASELFLKYEAEGDETYYAMGIIIGLDKPMVQSAIKTIERFYADASEEERKADFANFDFNENGKMIQNEKAAELGKCQLVFSIDEFPKNTLFINMLDFFQHYPAKDLDDNIPDVVASLLDKDLIELHKTRTVKRKTK